MFIFTPLYDLNRLVCCMWKSVERLKSYCWGYYHGNSPGAPLEWNLEFLMFYFCSASQAESIGILLVKIGCRVEKLFKGVFFLKFPHCSPKMKFREFLILPYVYACRAESIAILQVRIGWTGEELFNRVFWLEIPIGGVFSKKVSPRMNFG